MEKQKNLKKDLKKQLDEIKITDIKNYKHQSINISNSLNSPNYNRSNLNILNNNMENLYSNFLDRRIWLLAKNLDLFILQKSFVEIEEYSQRNQLYKLNVFEIVRNNIQNYLDQDTKLSNLTTKNIEKLLTEVEYETINSN